MAPLIHLIRHSEGFHNIPPEALHKDIYDARLTPAGEAACRDFASTLPSELHHVDLVCASPLQRTMSTALIALAPLLADGGKVLALPDAQEANADPSNTGSSLVELQAMPEFEGRVDWTILEAAPYWNTKVGIYGTRRGLLEERARRLRRWLRARPEKEIVIVGHGMFWHFMTGNIRHEQGGGQGEDDDPDEWMAQQTGPYWRNLMWRTFRFRDEADDMEARIVETRLSEQRTAQSLAVE